MMTARNEVPLPAATGGGDSQARAIRLEILRLARLEALDSGDAPAIRFPVDARTEILEAALQAARQRVDRLRGRIYLRLLHERRDPGSYELQILEGLPFAEDERVQLRGGLMTFRDPSGVLTTSVDASITSTAGAAETSIQAERFVSTGSHGTACGEAQQTADGRRQLVRFDDLGFAAVHPGDLQLAEGQT